VAAFDMTRYGKGKKKGFFAIMPKWLADELLRNKDLFRDMPARTSNVKFLKKATEKRWSEQH